MGELSTSRRTLGWTGEIGPRCRGQRRDLHYAVSGSILKGTVQATWHEVRTHLEVESEAPSARAVPLVRNADGGCTAEYMVVQRVPLHSTVSLNGKPVAMG